MSECESVHQQRMLCTILKKRRNVTHQEVAMKRSRLATAHPPLHHRSTRPTALHKSINNLSVVGCSLLPQALRTIERMPYILPNQLIAIPPEESYRDWCNSDPDSLHDGSSPDYQLEATKLTARDVAEARRRSLELENDLVEASSQLQNALAAVSQPNAAETKVDLRSWREQDDTVVAAGHIPSERQLFDLLPSKQLTKERLARPTEHTAVKQYTQPTIGVVAQQVSGYSIADGIKFLEHRSLQRIPREVQMLFLKTKGFSEEMISRCYEVLDLDHSFAAGQPACTAHEGAGSHAEGGGLPTHLPHVFIGIQDGRRRDRHLAKTRRGKGDVTSVGIGVTVLSVSNFTIHLEF